MPSSYRSCPDKAGGLDSLFQSSQPDSTVKERTEECCRYWSKITRWDLRFGVEVIDRWSAEFEFKAKNSVTGKEGEEELHKRQVESQA